MIQRSGGKKIRYFLSQKSFCQAKGQIILLAVRKLSTWEKDQMDTRYGSEEGGGQLWTEPRGHTTYRVSKKSRHFFEALYL